MRVRDNFDDTALKLGIARALDLSLEKAAELAECSVSTAQRRLAETHVQRLESITRTLLAQRTEKVTTKVLSDAKERMEWIFDESFKLTEKLLQKAVAAGDDISAADLMEIHKNITVWATKYRVSEAPKRMQVEGSQLHVHAHVLSLEEAENVFRTRQMIQPSRPALGGDADVIDVDCN